MSCRSGITVVHYDDILEYAYSSCDVDVEDRRQAGKNGHQVLMLSCIQGMLPLISNERDRLSNSFESIVRS